jgi:hypothetical protein
MHWVLRVRAARPFEAELSCEESASALAEADSNESRVPRERSDSGPIRVRETTATFVSLAARCLRRAGSDARHVLPYEVRVGSLATVRRGLSILRPEIEVVSAEGAALGRLRQRLWANAGGFEALEASGSRLGALRLREDASIIADAEGRTLAEMRPPSGRERRIGIAPSLGPPASVLLLATLAALDRILDG